MARRKLTPAEIKGYRDLARAAARLRRAQIRAECRWALAKEPPKAVRHDT